MITSRNNREIIETVKLRKKKHREEEKLFLIDGTKLLFEALNSDIPIQKIYAVKDWLEKNANHLMELEIEEVSIPVMEKLSGVKSSEGVVAIAQIIPQNTLDYSDKVVILEDIRDPGNLGTIIRTADAFGYQNIILSKNCADIYNEKTLRSTMGSLFHINIFTNLDILKSIEELKNKQYTIIGTSLAGKDVEINNIEIPEKVAIVLGNESNGISEAVLKECTSLQKLPIIGAAESLNVSVAAGIFLFLYK